MQSNRDIRLSWRFTHCVSDTLILSWPDQSGHNDAINEKMWVDSKWIISSLYIRLA